MRQYEIGQNAIDVSELYNRFMQGKIGERFKRLIKNEQVASYYVENIIVWSKNLCNTISDKEKRETFEQIISVQMLEFNFQIQLISMVFSEALSMWMNGIEDLDSNIIELLNIESVKKTVEFVQQMLIAVVSDYEDDTDSGIPVVTLQSFPSSGNLQVEENIPDFRIMKNNGNNKLN